MRKILLLLTLFLGVPALHAEELLVVKSLKSRAYSEVVQSARKSCNKVATRELVLSDMADTDVARIIRESRAKAVLAVGDIAFKKATQQRKIPVIGVLTLESAVTAPNVKSISYLAPPEKYLHVFKASRKTHVGMVFDGKIWPYVRKAARLARTFGITLELREIKSPTDVPAALASFSGAEIDALWVVPDTNVVTAGTVQPILRFAAANNIPAFIFSKVYLKEGAVMAIEPEVADIGKQAGQLICQAIEDGVIAGSANLAASSYSNCGNPPLALKLGVPQNLFEPNCSVNN